MTVITLLFCNTVIKVRDEAFIQPTDSLLAQVWELKVGESLNLETMGSTVYVYSLAVECLCIRLHHNNLILILPV